MSHETGGQESSKNQDYNTEIAFSNINVSEPIPEVSKNQDYGTGIAFSNINVSEPIPESSKNQDYTTTPEPESKKLSQGNKRQKVGKKKQSGYKKKPKVGYKKQRRGNKKEKLANKEQSVADRGSLKIEKNSFKIYPTEEIAFESGRNLSFICLVFENFFAFGFPFDFWVNRRPNKKKQKPFIKKQKRGNKGKV